MIADVPDPRVKGIAFREFVRWYERTYGRDATLKAWRAVPDALRAELDPERDAFGLLASTWYPIGVATSLLEAITWGLALEERSALLRGGVAHALDVTISGVYKVLFDRLFTPERHAKYAQKIWSNFYNTGEVVGRIVGPGRAEQLVRDWNGHHPLLCELSLWSLTTFHERMGCKNVKVSRSSCVRDSPECRFVITWSETS